MHTRSSEIYLWPYNFSNELFEQRIKMPIILLSTFPQRADQANTYKQQKRPNNSEPLLSWQFYMYCQLQVLHKFAIRVPQENKCKGQMRTSSKWAYCLCEKHLRDESFQLSLGWHQDKRTTDSLTSPLFLFQAKRALWHLYNANTA